MSKFFEAWPKIPRLGSKCSITEKIDGTNASILIVNEIEFEQGGEWEHLADWMRNDLKNVRATTAINGETCSIIWAFSRKRLIFPGEDNFGFGWWVHENAQAINDLLGPGRHFGEWWGSGIQRGYGLKEKRFSLFNAYRWNWLNNPEVREETGIHIPLYCVPELYRGNFGVPPMFNAIELLKVGGSEAVPDYPNAEGLVVHFRDNDSPFKYVLNAGKGGKVEDDFLV